MYDRDMRWCPICEKHLPLSRFGEDMRTKDNLTYNCKVCASICVSEDDHTPKITVTEKECFKLKEERKNNG